MSWNGSGTFGLVDTVENATIATADEVNAIWQDQATGINACLAKNGENAMTGQLKAASGTVSAPGITFSADLDCGFYRIGPNNIGVAVNGAKVLDIATTGLSITGTLTASGQFIASAGDKSAPGYSFSGDLDNGMFLKGENNIAFSAGDTEIFSLTTAGAAIAGVLGVSGNLAINTDKFTVAAATGNVAFAGNLAINTDKFTVAAASGNASIGGTLSVTGALTASASVGIAARNAAKAYAMFTVAATTVSFNPSTQGFNVASVTRQGTGNYNITFTSALPTANYSVTSAGNIDGTQTTVAYPISKTVNGFTLVVRNPASSNVGDPAALDFTVFGF